MKSRSGKKIKSTRPDPRTRFSKSQICQIVKELEEGLSRKEVCEKYGMAGVTLQNWLNMYGSERYHASKKPTYSMAFKRDIVHAVKEGRMTKKEVCVSHNINLGLLNSWISYFKKEEELLTGGQDNTMSENLHTPFQKNDELAQAKLKIKALETLIDVAEEQFKISIRKKPGAKQ